MAVDDEVIVDYKTSCAIFNYSFKLDGYYFNIVQIADGKFDLKINSFFFKELKEAEEQGELNNKGDKTNEENLDEDENEEENNINNINNYKYDNNKKKYGYNNNNIKQNENEGGDNDEGGLID